MLPMNILKTYSLVVLVALFFAIDGYSQQVTVLINGVPTKISQNDSELTDIHNELSASYMSGFELAPSDPFQKVRPKLQSELVSPQIAVASETPKPVVRTEVNKELNFDNSLFFKPGTADLTTKAQEAIKSYAQQIKDGKAKSVLLKSWHLANNKISEQLVKSRLDACQEVFVKMGIGTNVIVSSLTAAAEESKFVTIQLQ